MQCCMSDSGSGWSDFRHWMAPRSRRLGYYLFSAASPFPGGCSSVAVGSARPGERVKRAPKGSTIGKFHGLRRIGGTNDRAHRIVSGCQDAARELEAEPPKRSGPASAIYWVQDQARAGSRIHDAAFCDHRGLSKVIEKEDFMHIVHVSIHVKPDQLEEFKRITIDNARNSLEEPGVARFDFVQEAEDRTRFVLVEVYRTTEAVTAHKATAHYNRWREAVEPLLAEPRTRTVCENVYPPNSAWG